MFTGIVEEIGRAAEIDRREGAIALTFDCHIVLHGANIGDSISVNGVCLTVVAMHESSFTVEAVPETLRRTNLGLLEVGSPVNLERSVTQDRTMGGHYVQGHVDGTVRVTHMETDGEAVNYTFELTEETDPNLIRYIVPKGYVAVDGTSLTVVDVTEKGFTLTLIPHTQTSVVLGRERIGYIANIEVDIMAKYVEKILGDRLSQLEARIAAIEGR
jgi:riboflavin synthase